MSGAAWLSLILSAGAPPDLSHAPVLPPPPAWEVPVPAEVTAAGVHWVVLPQKALPLVHVLAVVRAGAELDPPDAPGLAALVASSLRDCGAGKRTGPEVAEALAQLGTVLHVHTAPEASQFSLEVLAKNFPDALGVLADVLARPKLDAAEVAVTRAQQLSEVQKRREEPRHIADDVFQRVVYRDHPFGHPLLGTPESVAAATVDSVKAFYAARYRPAAVTIVLVGQVELKDVARLADAAFGGWKVDGPPAAPVAAPVRAPARFVAVDRPGAAQSELRVGGVGIPRASPDFAAMEVLETILGGSFTSRLNQNLREKNGYTYGVFCHFQPGRLAGPFAVRTAVRTNVTRESLVEIRRELEGIRKPLEAKELDKGRTLVRGNLVDEYADGERASAAIADLVESGAGLDGWGRALAAMKDLDPAGAGAASARLFEPEAMNVVVVGDRKAIEPELKKLTGVPKLEWVAVDGKAK